VSLFIDPAIARTEVLAKTPSGDVGLGDLSVKFELGPALVDTIRGAAQATFPTAQVVEAPSCAPRTEALVEASLPAAPYVQVNWRDETPRVGGGTVAEIIVRVIDRDCAGREMARAVAYGDGRNENLQIGANWPGEDDFRPGIERALDDLRFNLTELFRDMRGTEKEP